MFSEKDKKFMREALRLAEKGRGLTSPDPMVGSVVVSRGGKVVGRGYHAEVTTPHAESFALTKAGKLARCGTIYVTLEPCCHWGNNPPCTTKIIKSGIKRVVAAMKDPNPLMSGKGFKELELAGIRVEAGLLEEEAKKLNEVFIKHITSGRPFVTVKAAMSLDGKIATTKGESAWISGRKSREFAQIVRSSVDAIMVGVNTVLLDDPMLNVRARKLKNRNKRQPVRIILDSFARISLTSKVVCQGANTIVVVSRRAPDRKLKALEKKGVQILVFEEKKGKIDIGALIRELGARQITSILIEGGGEVNASAFEAGIVDKALFFIAPVIIGGKDAKTPVEGGGIASLSEAYKIKELKVRKLGEDFIFEGRM